MIVFEQVQEIFRDVFDDEALVITRETSQDDIDDWDSLAQISIISMTQDVFGIEFEISEITDFSDVGSLIDIIIKKTQSEPRA